MTEQRHLGLEVIERTEPTAGLDLVVPFTTPQLTRAAVRAANSLGTGLNATIRLVMIRLVPYPLPLNEPEAYLDLLSEQLSQFESEIPVAAEIRLAREAEPALKDTLRSGSVVILATSRRPWRTNNERLATSLRRAGHKVILICEDGRNSCLPARTQPVINRPFTNHRVTKEKSCWS